MSIGDEEGSIGITRRALQNARISVNFSPTLIPSYRINDVRVPSRALRVNFVAFGESMLERSATVLAFEGNCEREL